MDSPDKQPRKPTAVKITHATKRARSKEQDAAHREKMSEEFLKIYYASSVLANPHIAVDGAKRMDAGEGSTPSHPPEGQPPLDC